MARPEPQYGVPLSVAEVPLKLPINPIYGVTPSSEYIPIQVDAEGKLSLASVTIGGSVTVSNFPATQAVTQSGTWTVALSSGSIEIGTVDQGTPASLTNAWPTKVTDGIHVLAVNDDGSLNVDLSSSGSIPVTIDHSLDSVAIYGTDGTTDRFIKTDASGNIQVGVINTSLAVTQSTSPWVVSGTATVSGTVTANQGTANATPWNENIAQIAGSTIAVAAAGIAKVGLTDGSGNTISSTSNALDVNIKSTTNGAASASPTSKARSNASQTFLALNANRKGATIYNDSSALLYVKFGAVATTSDFTVRLATQSYYEVPFNYPGRIDGIWASAGTGAALITELA